MESPTNDTHPLRVDDEIAEDELVTLVKHAIEEEHPERDLQQVFEWIQNSPHPLEIDSLAITPLLLPCSMRGAQDLLVLIGKESNAKELMIAAQESSERLSNSLAASLLDSNDEESEDEHGNLASLAQQVVRIINLYSTGIPRLTKHRKPPTKIIQPLLSDIEALLLLVSKRCTSGEAKDLITSCSRLAESIISWIGDDPDEIANAVVSLESFLRSSLVSCINSVDDNIAEKTFKLHFPRYSRPSSPDDTDDDVDVIGCCLRSLSRMGLGRNDFINHPTPSSIILLAHCESPVLDLRELEILLPVLIMSVQSNIALDETLVLLIATLDLLHSSSRKDIPTSVAIPLVHILAPLASSHPDSSTRHIVFRLLSLALSLSPSPIRLRLLRELLTDTETSPPQMRVAAIGLVKEATLEALSQPRPSQGSQDNAFTSPLFMRELGSVIFTFHAKGFKLEDDSLAGFQESPQPLRLVESLGLYYILMLRDVENQTGVRDPAIIKEVDSDLVSPLRTRLGEWQSESRNSEEHTHGTMQLGILEMWLERVTSAIRSVREAAT